MKVTSQTLNIPGPCGQIQALLDMPEQVNSGYIAINCHPHSLHGGSMTNKVVYTLARAVASFGIPSLRFNFRSVGESAGEYDEGVGEQQDIQAVLDWMNNQYPQSQLILTGFSFGSYVSACIANGLNPSLLLSVAPPIKRFNFDNFVRPINDWTVIMGDQDELVDYTEVKAWVNQFDSPPNFLTIQNASHFFHGKLVDLRSLVEETVSQFLDTRAS